MTVNVTCRSFEFENCMSDTDSFLFLLIRLPSPRRCGLAETVGLCFALTPIVRRLSSSWVLCVCLFCFVVVVVVVAVALFVVG